MQTPVAGTGLRMAGTGLRAAGRGQNTSQEKFSIALSGLTSRVFLSSVEWMGMEPFSAKSEEGGCLWKASKPRFPLLSESKVFL